MPSNESATAVVRIWPSARQGRAVTAGQDYGPPAPPLWASHSVVEDGGVTHELVSDVRLVVARTCTASEDPGRTFPADVSVSVVDSPTGYGWSRTLPTLQVEGGSYSLQDGLLLARAIQDLVMLTARA